MKQFLTESEAAKMLRVTVRTIQRWRKSGDKGLPFMKAGRRILYNAEDLEAWAKSQSQSS